MFRGVRDLVGEVERPQRLERRTRTFARPGALISDRMIERLLARPRRAWRRGRPTLRRSRRAADTGDVGARGTGRHHGGTRRDRDYLWESGWVPFTILWNVTGQPAASVPAGCTRDGLPLAVQLVGRPHDESTLLSLAAELEAERRWTDRTPAVAAI